MAEHCVKVILKLSSQNGTREELAKIFELEDLISSFIEEHEVGEYDGNEVGQGEFTMYMYGTDADVLFRSIQPVLQRSPLTHGGYAIKRYGPPEEEVREVRMEL